MPSAKKTGGVVGVTRHRQNARILVWIRTKQRTGKIGSVWDSETRLLSRLPELLPRTVSVHRSALTQIICKCLFLYRNSLNLHRIRSRGRSRRVRAERLTFEIQSSSDPAEPRQRKPNRIRREGYSQARSRDTAFVCAAGPGFETNDIVRPDEHVLGPPLGMRRVSEDFVPYHCRQLPGNAEPFTRLKTRSEHGLLSPNATGHAFPRDL